VTFLGVKVCNQKLCSTRDPETRDIPLDVPMYIRPISFKKAFGSYLDCNIAIPPIFKTRSTVDPGFNRMKCLNDRDNTNRCLMNALTANIASCSTDAMEAAPASSTYFTHSDELYEGY